MIRNPGVRSTVKKIANHRFVPVLYRMKKSRYAEVISRIDISAAVHQERTDVGVTRRPQRRLAVIVSSIDFCVRMAQKPFADSNVISM